MSNIERPSFFFDSFKKEAIFLAQKKIFEQVNKPSILKDKIQATIVPSEEHLELSNQDIDEIFLQVSEIIKRECLILSTTDVQKILREANAAMYWYIDKIKKDQEKARVKSIILEKTPQHLEKNLVMQIEKKITDEFANKIKKDIMLFDENELTLNDDVLDRMIITTTENFTFSDDEIKRIHILLYNIAKLKLEELTCNKRKDN